MQSHENLRQRGGGSNVACSGQGLAKCVMRLSQGELDSVWEARVRRNLIAFYQLSVDRPADIYNEQRATYSNMSGVVVSQAIKLILAFKARQGLRQFALRPTDCPGVVKYQLHRLYLPPSYVRNG